MNEYSQMVNFSRVANKYNFGIASKATKFLGKVFRKYGDDAFRAVDKTASKFGDDVGNIAYKRPSNVKIDFRDWRKLLTKEDDKAIKNLFNSAYPDPIGAGRYDGYLFSWSDAFELKGASKKWADKALNSKEWQDFLLEQARKFEKQSFIVDPMSPDGLNIDRKFFDILKKEGCSGKDLEELLKEMHVYNYKRKALDLPLNLSEK